MTEPRCPKCNETYPSGAAVCPHCAAPLVRICPTCGQRRPWYVAECPRCSSRASDAHMFAGLFRETPRERLKGRYVIEDVLSSGQTGRVMRAVDRRSNQPVVIKELSLVRLFRADERRQGLSGLYHQVERWQGIRHVALPTIHDTFELQDHVYVVMDLVEGWDGGRILQERSIRVSPELARNWGAQLCDLLSVLHRQEPPLDATFLTPEHLMVTPRGEVRLVGLGLGRFVAPTTYGPYGGTQGYAAPELDTGFPGPRSDVYAVARVLYALLAGVDLARQGSQAAPLQRTVPGIATQLVKAIARAAHRDPQRRFASTRQFRRALWDETYGPLESIDNWYQTAKRSAPDVTSRPVPSQSSGVQTMEDLGFAADNRFGPQSTIEPAQLPATATTGLTTARAAVSLQPRSLQVRDVGATERRRLVLTVRNVGEVEISGRLLSHVSWLKAPAKALVLPPGKQAKVLFTLDARELSEGKVSEPQALSLESNAGTHWVSVIVDIASGPQLLVESTMHDLGEIDNDAPQPFAVALRNNGRQLLSGAVASRVPWLRIDRPEFRCRAGETSQVTVVCLPERLPKGPQAAREALAIASDGGQAVIEVRAWRRRPALELGASHMDLGLVRAGEVAERYLIVANTGDGRLEGAARSLVPWLQAFPREFALEPGGMAQITVTADLAGLPDGPISMAQALRVQSNGGVESMSLQATVSAPRLTLTQDRLNFGAVVHGQSPELGLMLNNEGTAALALTVATLVPWLRASVDSVLLEPGQSEMLRLSADTRHFDHGETIEVEAALRLIQPTTMRDLPASITIVKPALRVEPEIVDLGYVDPSVVERRIVTVANDGNGRLAWTAATAAPWVEIEPSAGVCAPWQEQTIELSAYGLMLPLEAESDESSLVINSDAGRAKVTLRIAKAHPLIAADAMLVDMGPSVNRAPVSASLRLFNHGLGQLRGTVSASEPWIELDRVSFECATGRSTEIVLRADPTELPRDQTLVEATLDVRSNGGDLHIDVLLAIELQAALESPDRATLVRSTSGYEGRLAIRNHGLAPARISLRATDPGIELSREQIDIKPDGSVRIRITSSAQPALDAAIEVTCGTDRWTILLDSVQ